MWQFTSEYFSWCYNRCPLFHPAPAFITLLSVSMAYTYVYICSLANLFQSPHPHPSVDSQPIPWIHASVFILFVSLFCSSDLSEIIWYWSFSDWLISLSIMFSRSIHAVAKVSSFFFHSHVVFHCVNVPQLFNLLTYWWALGLLPVLGYCK